MKILFFYSKCFEWKLFLKFMAENVQTCLQSGALESPRKLLETYRQRLQIGEVFIKWADEYYSDQSRIGERITRRKLYNEYLNYSPEQLKFCSPIVFKKKFINYCALKGYFFNPGRYDPVYGLPLFFDQDGKPDLDDKSNGLEYFAIGKKESANPSPENLSDI